MATPEPMTSSKDISALAAEAELALSKEDWQAAAEACQQLVAREPQNPEHRFKLVQAYDELGRAEDALEALNDPVLAGLEKTKRRLARIYIDLKDYAAAIPLIDELIAANPKNAKFAKWKAVCDEKGGDAQAAESIQRGQKLVEEGRLDEAEQLYVELLASYPRIARAWLHLGQIYAQQKRWTEAMVPLRTGLEVDPDSAKLKNALARVLLKSGDPRQAVALLNSGKGVGEDRDGLFLLQRCHVELEEWELAAAAAQRLLSMLPPEDPLRAQVKELEEEVLVRHELAGVESAAGTSDREATIAAYRQVVARHPKSAIAWLALGTALSDAGRHGEAADALRDALTSLPDHADIRAARTRAIIALDDEALILRHVTAVIEAGTGDFEAFRWLARYRAEREQWDESLDSARAASALDPANASPRAMLVRALIHVDRLQEASAEVEGLLATGDKTVEALQLKGDIFVRLGRLNEAITHYCKGLQLSRRDIPLREALSHALSLNTRAEHFPLRTLSELPIEVDAAAIEEAMRPFLGSEIDDEPWNKRHNKVWRRAVDRVAAGQQATRDRQLVEEEYAMWATMGFDRYGTHRTDLTATPWTWRGRRLSLDGGGAARLRAVLFAGIINDLKPHRVLEVGSGNGINLLTLAGGFPDIEFTGVELTEEGVDAARRAQSDDRTAQIIREYSPAETLDPSASGRIRFVQGDASALPFEDNSFDLVMTVLAVEQMESIRSAALSEIARVSRRHVLMLEPFRDLNQGALQALYVHSRGYLRGSISELRDFGLEPLWATDDFPHETFLGTALVLAEKRRA